MKRTLGHALKHFRTRAGLSQEQLADRVGTDANNISRMERNHHSPSLEMLAQLAAALGVSRSDIFRHADGEEGLRDGDGQYAGHQDLHADIAALPDGIRAALGLIVAGLLKQTGNG